MMEGQIRIIFNSDGFRQILTGGGVQDLVKSTTEGIAARATANISEESEGFKSEVILGNYGGGRYVGFISTTDRASMIAESEEKALSKAVTG